MFQNLRRRALIFYSFSLRLLSAFICIGTVVNDVKIMTLLSNSQKFQNYIVAIEK